MKRNLTQGNILKELLLFSIPMIFGNLLQQIYNITDTIIVGRFIGADALASVGASYTLMTFLTSVIIGLCMGCGSLFSMLYGAHKIDEMKQSMWTAFWMILLVTIIIYIIILPGTDFLLHLLQIPSEIYTMMRSYIQIIFIGLGFTFLYNYFAFIMRAMGNSVTPLIFLIISTCINIGLDFWFVIGLDLCITGAAKATVIAQGVSGIGIMIYAFCKTPLLRLSEKHRRLNANVIKNVGRYAFITCIQQSVMNFGILMIQGLVNSFGTIIMAAFAAAVKIDTLAYMPAQEFGNAFSLFISQNHGAGKSDRVEKGIKLSVLASVLFCICISFIVCIFAKPFLGIFVNANETAIITEGIRYLHIEGAFYWGIGCLFLLYGLYRAIEKPEMSLLLTVVSLGTRVFLSYLLAPRTSLGVTAIWCSIPIGWLLADLIGFFYYIKMRKQSKRFDS